MTSPAVHTTSRRDPPPTNGTDRRRTVHVVCSGRVGRTLAERLIADGARVRLVDDTPGAPPEVPGDDVTVLAGDPTDPAVLDAAGLDEADAVLAATRDDGRNLLVAQLARTRFGVETIVVRVNDPDRLDTFRSLDYETVCVESNVGEALAGRLG